MATQQTQKKDAAKPKKKSRVEAEGIAFVTTSFNNIIVTMTDRSGNAISWASAGKAGFKGSKKNTPYAAQISASEAAKEAYDLGLRRVIVYVKGTGAGRESAMRAINASGIEVVRIEDITPLPHNGCRPPKKRRV
jgi:small subunit ribosomal protein S11